MNTCGKSPRPVIHLLNESTMTQNFPLAHVTSSRPFAPEEITVGDLLRNIAAECPDKRALTMLRDPVTGEQRSWTYAQLLEASEAVAQQLLQKFKPGDHITLWSSNRPEWLFVQFGAAMAGLVLVAVSPASRSHELGYVLQQSDSVGIIYTKTMGKTDCAALLEALRPECPKLREVIAFDDWTDIGKPTVNPQPLPTVKPRQPAMIQYTSGTTGKPKGALIAHYSLVNATKTIETTFELERHSVWLNTVPLYTTSGCVFTAITCIWNRGNQVLLPNFDPALVFRGVTEERANWIPLVPTMAVAVLDHPDRAKCDFSSVKVVVTGGSPVAPDIVQRIERDMKVDFMMVFGQTESSSAVCLTHRKDTVEHRTTTIGYPLGGFELRICDPETNRTLNFGEIGEICMRGPSVMLGYYNMPDATKSALDAEGWLHSGDLGTLSEEGYPKITGRLKDMIIRGGSNIYPRELEDVFSEHPLIAESAVFGIPEPKYGELVVAAIRLRPGAALDSAGVAAYLNDRVARYKVPSHVWFVDQFPLTPSGKIQKFVMRDQFLALHPGLVVAKA